MNPAYDVVNTYTGVDVTPNMFVRGQDGIAVDSMATAGLRISREFFETVMKPEKFIDMCWEMLDKCSAIIPLCEEQIKEAHIQSGLSIEELSLKSGVSIENITEMEDGKRKRVSIHEIKKVCDVLNVDVRTLGFPKNWLK